MSRSRLASRKRPWVFTPAEPRSEERGTWSIVFEDDGSKLFMRCPMCGHGGVVKAKVVPMRHDGYVLPRMFCGMIGCNWSGMALLRDFRTRA